MLTKDSRVRAKGLPSLGHSRQHELHVCISSLWLLRPMGVVQVIPRWVLCPWWVHFTAEEHWPYEAQIFYKGSPSQRTKPLPCRKTPSLSSKTVEIKTSLREGQRKNLCSQTHRNLRNPWKIVSQYVSPIVSFLSLMLFLWHSFILSEVLMVPRCIQNLVLSVVPSNMTWY